MAGEDIGTTGDGSDRERRAREIAEEAERTRNPGNATYGPGDELPESGEDMGTGEDHWKPGSAEDPAPSPLGKGDTHAVASDDVEQPEIAAGPTAGMQPGETVERGPWIPPVEVDPPKGGDLPRDAAGEPEAVRRQKEEGGP
ncbi:hypothetical protein F0L17_22330 [Streptomyces sp. TRM43335]|uniref:DUF5709 domain-containing protein n=1 Tax=Streptomyces taklimakanensis TaxID=2569853 RepID=A0A6G2BIT3_9ACTN|nr:hypothetical protein [Streptomyces taklimakanensis]MTE21802.1 hypothetical protein [Streptomyces taklimakanensis]